MGKLLFSLAIIIGAMAAGQAFHLGIRKEKARKATDGMMDRIRKALVLFVTPIISLGAFWIVDFSSLSLLSVPLIGAATLGMGVLLSIIASKGAPSQQAAEGLLLLLRKRIQRRHHRRAFMLCFLWRAGLLAIGDVLPAFHTVSLFCFFYRRRLLFRQAHLSEPFKKAAWR